MRLNQHKSLGYVEQFQTVEARFKLLFDDPEEFYRLIEMGLNYTNAKQTKEKLAVLRSGFFSEELLQALICAGEPFQPAPINFIWSRLVEREIVIRSWGFLPGAFVDHNLVLPLLAVHLGADTLMNVFNPPSELVERYASAIAAIDVIDRDGDPSRGTGFIAVANNSQVLRLFTCKHNIDPAEGIEVVKIETASGHRIDVGSWDLHPTEDIAVGSMTIEELGGPALRFYDDVRVFDDVYTLGFPMVPRAEGQIIGHRGELNGIVQPYQGGSQLLLISNLVSPGSSGGPVLDRDGFCVGMSVQWLEAEWGKERARFSAALPASLLRLQC